LAVNGWDEVVDYTADIEDIELYGLDINIKMISNY